MEFSDSPLARARGQAETHQAPPSLLAGLNQRLMEYRQFSCSDAISLEEAQQHPNWEVRCAALMCEGERISPRDLEHVLHDEDYIVRQTAVHTLARLGAADTSLKLLEDSLQDKAWQVREMALLAAGAYQLPLSASNLRTASQDKSEPVRRAAGYASAHLKWDQDSTRISVSQVEPLVPGKRRRKVAPLRVGLLAACLVLILATLTAAGYGLGWWSPLLGSATQYTTLNQELTIKGVTVRLIKAYADQGRVIIVYDTLNASPDGLLVEPVGITSSFPLRSNNVKGGGGYIQIDQQNPRLRHSFVVYDPLAVPAAVQTVRLTWTLDLFSIKNSKVKEPPVHEGTFTFTFTLPFHHENRQDITLPFGMGA